MSNNNAIRQFAQNLVKQQKSASTPDRMTSADGGNGAVEVSSASVKKDPNVDDLKKDVPADGAPRDSASNASTPDRMTAADGGNGAVEVSTGAVKSDPNLADLKKDVPADGEPRKAASLQGLVQAAVAKFRTKEASAPAATNSQTKEAGEGSPLQFSQDVLAKLASACLADEEGADFMYRVVEKSAGREAALARVQEAMQAADVVDQYEDVKSASAQDYLNLTSQNLDLLKSAGIDEHDAEFILKQAAYIEHLSEELCKEASSEEEATIIKMAMAQGMEDQAMLEEAMAGAEGAEGEVPEEALPMGGLEGLTEEDLVALIEELLASGEITPEELEQIVQQAA